MSPEQFSGWLESKSQPQNPFNKPLIMGILNVTADSFSDAGLFLSVENAVERALYLISSGADIIDIGGESTKPGACEVSLDDELARVIPVIEKIRTHSNICISIDSYKPKVMEAAIKAGANIINDVYALKMEGALAMAAHLGVPICLMHMKGTPRMMQINPNYPDGVMFEIIQFFEERINACKEFGIGPKQLILDPGFGFGKKIVHNLEILRQLETLHRFHLPVLLGVSRKSTIGKLLDKPVNQRVIGSISLSVYAAMKGVTILRTHDVDETQQALQIIEAIYYNSKVGEDD